ncbi:MAG: hypothetical protein Ct9H300mP16_13200 [Pseudomonadota bacterium]|nr:MAG: hypothetical protein Ct9H300mP16_13200 [Pseudomonadota bacterium]
MPRPRLLWAFPGHPILQHLRCRCGHHRCALVAGSAGKYAGVDKAEWVLAPQRVRQQSARYPTGYIQELDIDIFEHLRVVDMGDAEISPDVNTHPTAENILKAQTAVESLVNQALDAGAIPVVIGQNSPCGSYASPSPSLSAAKERWA